LNITATRDTTTTYSSSVGSAKLVATDAGIYAQSVNVGNTSTYVLEGYVYTNGSAVTSSDLELYYNGSTITTTFTHVGSNWYKMLGTLTGANESRNYGVQVKSGKTVYIDNMSLSLGYNTSGTLTSSIFDAENPAGWGNLTFTTDGVQTSTIKVRTSNNSDMGGATDFASCSAISSGSDISSNNCVSDNHRYIQYQIGLSTSDVTQAPVFQDISMAFTAGTHTAKTYYVDATGGNDSNNGTSTSTPWQTISNVNIAMDSSVIEAGDTIYFEKGETFTGFLDVDVSGSSSKAITFGAYGSGDKPIINASGNTSAVDLTGRSYITVENLNLKNATTQGVYLYNSGSNITINGVDIDNSTNGFHISIGTFSTISISSSTITTFTYGINVENTTSVSSLTIDGVTASSGTNGILMADSGTFSGVSISNSTFSSNSGAGISITGAHTNLSLESVTANLNTLQGFLFAAVSGTTNLTVTNSQFNQNTDIGLQMTGTGNGATITNTVTSNNLWDGLNLKGDWTNIVIDNSTANSNGVDGVGGDGDGFTAHNNVSATIKNSVARNNLQGNISFVDNSSARLEYNEFTLTTASTHGSVWVTGTGDHWIYNNVIYNALQNGYGIEIGRLDAKTVTVKNNIVYGFQYGIFQDTPYASTVVEDYNAIYNYGVNDRSGFTGGSHTLNQNPLFTNASNNDFTLQSTSPGINAGTDVGLTSDYNGNSVPQGSGVDMGAHEFLIPTSASSLSQSVSGSNLTFTMSMLSSNSVDSLTPQIEIQRIGTAFTNIPTHSGSAVSSTGSSVIGTISISNFGSGTYHWQARASNSVGQSSWVSYGGNSESDTDIDIPFAAAAPPQCNDSKPSSAPWLYSAITQNNTSVLLNFTKVENNVDKYAIEYGLKSGNYIYAAGNIGDANTNSYLVQYLLPNTTYYFRVRGGNGCATGDWSNEISVTTGSLVSSKKLQITKTTLEPVVSERPTSCREYTVQSGDNLWNIAQSELGDGTDPHPLNYDKCL